MNPDGFVKLTPAICIMWEAMATTLIASQFWQRVLEWKPFWYLKYLASYTSVIDNLKNYFFYAQHSVKKCKLDSKNKSIKSYFLSVLRMKCIKFEFEASRCKCVLRYALPLFAFPQMDLSNRIFVEKQKNRRSIATRTRFEVSFDYQFNVNIFECCGLFA